MKHYTFPIIVACLLFITCKKNDNEAKVEIYALKTYSLVPTQCKVEPTSAVLADTPLIKNENILGYSQAAYEFMVDSAGSSKVRDLQGAFAVTVNKQIIYYGIFKPFTSSSSCNQSITISAISNKLMVRLGYPTLTGIYIDDQRNNPILITALQKQGKLQ